MACKEQKINEIRNELIKMIEELEIRSKSDTPLHEIERGLFKSLLGLGFQLLSYYIILVQERMERVPMRLDLLGKPLQNKGMVSRRYRSVFGLLQIRRRKYWSTSAKTYYPLDKSLGLGSSSYSYLLDDWLGYSSVEMDFDQSVGLVNRILDQDLLAMQASRRTYAISGQVEDYYEVRQRAPSKCFTHLCVGYDGKGIPIRRSQTDRAEESVVSRLAKGKKKDVKREATLSLSSSFTAKQRSAQQIIEALFSTQVQKEGDKDTLTHKWHQDKHIRAFLSNKPKAIEYGLMDVLSRDPSQQKPIVVLMDGAPSLENTVKRLVGEKQIEHRIDAYILDFFHLLEYIWKVANAYLGEKSADREEWVKGQALMLLNSQSDQVLEQWRSIVATKELSSYKKTLLERSIKYLSNRPHMIDYKTYLEKGYPITTGAVESACGHFIKSRMERNAMHWGKQGAQKMLDIRAVKKNQDWKEYLDFFIKHEQKQLYQDAA